MRNLARPLWTTDLAPELTFVRFGPTADKDGARRSCPLSANSGHCHFQLPGERLAMMLTTLNVITTSPA